MALHKTVYRRVPSERPPSFIRPPPPPPPLFFHIERIGIVNAPPPFSERPLYRYLASDERPPSRYLASDAPTMHNQGVVTYAPPVEAFATGIKIGSNDQRYFSDRSSDHSHFHERSRIKKARRDVTIRQRTRTYAPRGAYRDLPGYRY